MATPLLLVPFREYGYYDGNRKVLEGEKLIETFHLSAVERASLKNGDSFTEPTNWFGKWEIATDFRATLKIIDYMTDARIILVDEDTSRRYTMFLSDFTLMIKALDIVNAQVTGVFGFVKKNNAYAIKLVSA